MFNVFTTAEADAFGLSPQELRTAEGCCIKRLHRGIYGVIRLCAKHTRFEQFTDDEMLSLIAEADSVNLNAAWHRVQKRIHVGKAACVAAYAKEGEVFSHTTAAILHGLPILTVPDTVQMISPGRSRPAKSFFRRQRQFEAWHTTDLQGFALTTPVRTALDLAMDESTELGVATLDAVLRQSGDQRERTLALANHVAESCSRLAASKRVRDTLQYANGLAESLGESFCMTKLRMLGVKNLEQQVTIRDTSGKPIARVDALLRDKGIIIEFDGLRKYQALERGGFNHDGKAFEREKQREHELHILGYKVVRIMWRELFDLAALRRRLAIEGVLP